MSGLVYLVDDDASVLKGLSRLLAAAGFAVETFDSASAFLEQYDGDVIACAVIDLAMPGIDGLALQHEINERQSLLPVVFLTGHGDIPTSVRAMKRGAVDFLTKPVDEEHLIDAVKRALDRCQSLHRIRREVVDIKRRLAALTPREREVLSYLISGRLNKQIAAELGTSEKTIKVHRARILEKMESTSLAELVRIAERANIKAVPTAGRSIR